MNMWVEGLAALLLLLNVWLVGERSLWSYAFGVAAVLLYAHVYFSAQLYALAALQAVFLALNLYGLLNWRAAVGRSGEVTVTRMARPEMAATGLIVTAIAATMALALRATDAASPVWDSATTALSLAAQYWQARRRVESWALWALVNLVTVALCLSQHLWITAATYALLLAMVARGWLRWVRAERGIA